GSGNRQHRCRGPDRSHQAQDRQENCRRRIQGGTHRQRCGRGGFPSGQRRRMKRLIGVGLLLAGAVYPFAVYYGTEHFAPWQFALLLGSLWLGRALTSEKRPGSLITPLVALGFCLLLGAFNSPLLLRWYPVLISASMLGLFG